MVAVSAAHAIRVLSIDDHPLLREGIAAIIGAREDMCLVGQAATARDGIREYHEKKPDITLMDVRLPDMNGINALMAIRSEAPNARIVMLSMFRGDVEIQRALKAGARGFLLKTMPPSEMGAALLRRRLFRLFIGVFARGRSLFGSFCAGTAPRTAPTRLFRAASPA